MRRQRFIASCLFVIGALTAMSADGALAADCPTCAKHDVLIARENARAKQMTDLIAKNKSYLESIGGGDVSKVLKVKSNIIVASTYKETAMNNVQAALKEKKDGGCDACQVPESQK